MTTLERMRWWLYERGCRAAVAQIRAVPHGYHVPNPNAIIVLAMKELDMDNPANMEIVGLALIRASRSR